MVTDLDSPEKEIVVPQMDKKDSRSAKKDVS